MQIEMVLKSGINPVSVLPRHLNDESERGGDRTKFEDRSLEESLNAIGGDRKCTDKDMDISCPLIVKYN